MTFLIITHASMVKLPSIENPYSYFSPHANSQIKGLFESSDLSQRNVETHGGHLATVSIDGICVQVSLFWTKLPFSVAPF